jgi:hypothetical protein
MKFSKGFNLRGIMSKNATTYGKSSLQRRLDCCACRLLPSSLLMAQLAVSMSVFTSHLLQK